MHTKNVRENHNIKSRNQTLTIVVVCLALSLVMSQVMFWTQRDNFTIHIPPSFRSGATLVPETHSAEGVWSFSNYIYQYLNNWSTNGEDDYKSNITDLDYYMSSQFASHLNADYAQLLNRDGINELSRRRRQLLPVQGKPFSIDMVTQVSEGVWDVTLNYQLVEFIGERKVKNELIEFVLRVIEADANPAGNQWGLQIHKELSTVRKNDEKANNL